MLKLLCDMSLTLKILINEIKWLIFRVIEGWLCIQEPSDIYIIELVVSFTMMS
jgi:hypothetical protein